MAEEGTGAGVAVLVEPNLMSAVAVEGALRRAGYQVRQQPLSTRPEQIAALNPSLILVSLSVPAASAWIRGLRACPETRHLAVIGYAGHVETDLLQAGREAGADLAAANSAVTQSLPELLAALARRRERRAD
ncbi:MAG: response regulator transcription factor [Armatimonadetes bacterium]|nr:response regulator transcription factor [Armatimonadota bacterium]